MQRVGPVAHRPPQQQGNRAATLRRKLEPAGLRHLHAPGLTHHGTQAAMPQPLLQQRQQLRIVTRLRIDHAAGGKTRLVQPRCEQVAGSHHP